MNRRAQRERGLGDDERSAHVPETDGEALRRLIQQFVRAIGLLSSDTTPCGQPIAVSHAHALMVLLEHGRTGRLPTQQELARTLGIDKSNVARLCRKMEEAGQLTQRPSEHDRRSRLLALTDRGLRLATAVERSSRERFQRLMVAVPRDERRSVVAALTVLNEALTGSGPASRSPGPGRSSSRPDRAGVPADARVRRLSRIRVAHTDGDHR